MLLLSNALAETAEQFTDGKDTKGEAITADGPIFIYFTPTTMESGPTSGST